MTRRRTPGEPAARPNMGAVSTVAAQGRKAERKRAHTTRYTDENGHLCFAEYCPVCNGTGWTKGANAAPVVSAKPDCPNHPGMGVVSCMRCAGLGFVVQYGAAAGV